MGVPHIVGRSEEKMSRSTKIVLLTLWAVVASPFLYTVIRIGIVNHYTIWDWLSIILPTSIGSPLDFIIWVSFILMLIAPVYIVLLRRKQDIDRS